MESLKEITDIVPVDSSIIMNYQDIDRYFNFVNVSSEDKTISKEFYDWYLFEKTFILKKGYLLIHDIFEQGKEHNLNNQYCSIIHFDITDIDNAKFSIYTNNMDLVTYLTFVQKYNLNLDKPRIHVHQFDWDKSGSFFITHGSRSLKEEWRDINATMNKSTSTYRKGQAFKNRYKRFKKDIINHFGSYMMQVFFAFMYYNTKNPPQDVNLKSSLDPTVNTMIKSIYKYDGHINLEDRRIFHPKIKRDPDAPIRNYERHIEAWRVRGHYRRTNGNLIWIDPHVRGNGKLEDRTYSTVDGKDLNLPVKEFEVLRAVSAKQIKVKHHKIYDKPKDRKLKDISLKDRILNRIVFIFKKLLNKI